MLRRLRPLAFVLAAALAMCSFNCLGHSAQGASLLVDSYKAAETGRDLPLKGNLLHCHNESGCICRGAVFVAPVVVQTIDLAVWDYLPAALDNRLAALELVPAAPPAAALDSLIFCPQLSGRILRALLASLLI